MKKIEVNSCEECLFFSVEPDYESMMEGLGSEQSKGNCALYDKMNDELSLFDLGDDIWVNCPLRYGGVLFIIRRQQ